MRRILSFIFLLIFLYSIIGYFPVFFLVQKNIKNQMKKYIDNNSCLVITDEMTIFDFNKTNFINIKWKEKNKEFFYENELYDVIAIKKNQNKNIRIYCVNDEKETLLINDFYKQIQHNSSPISERNQNSIMLSIDLYLFYILQLDFNINERTFLFAKYSKNLINYIKDIPSPPPKYFL